MELSIGEGDCFARLWCGSMAGEIDGGERRKNTGQLPWRILDLKLAVEQNLSRENIFLDARSVLLGLDRLLRRESMTN